MTAYTPLKIAILAVVISQNLHAITLDPIQIQSSSGELLYAEMNFRHADPDMSLQASLASLEDIQTLGVVHQPPGYLNFFTRRDRSGNGVITITSSRPLTETELNIIVKIQEGQATRLQHIKTPLKRQSNVIQAHHRLNEKPLQPITITHEKEIALQLPESTDYQNAASKQALEKPLIVQKKAPPSLNQVSTSFSLTASQNQQIKNTIPLTKNIAAATAFLKPEQQINSYSIPTTKPNPVVDAKPHQHVPSLDAQLKQPQKNNPSLESVKPKTVIKPSISALSTQTQVHINPTVIHTQTAPYIVQSNDSLWTIASQVAAEQNRPINQVMQHIKANNPHAFIQGNINRLRRGVALHLNSNIDAIKAPKNSKSNLAKITNKQSAKAKYRLHRAEMSIVAQHEQDSATSSAKNNTKTQQTSNDLSLKVMTAREKTVKLQRNVTQSELALNYKDQRIQLLNARLAQLQQQLKAQQAQKQPIH